MGTDRLGSLLSTTGMIFLLALLAVGLGAFNLPFAEDQLDQRVAAITELLKVTAIVFGGIAVLINAYYAAKQVEAMDKTAIATEKNIEIGLKNAALAEERLITERFGKAIEQLGDKSLQIRLGGIYALERVAQDSDKDYWPVMEVLTAFIREDTRTRTVQLKGGKPERFLVQTDVQAALTVLSRRTRSYKNGEAHRLDLSGVDLRGANLREANLAGANLSRADLSGAMLVGADLQGANLEGAVLNQTNLQEVNLHQTNLYKARLIEADLKNAKLWQTNLQDATLEKANLEGAIFEGIEAEGTNFKDSNFAEASGLSPKHIRPAITEKDELCRGK
ncbi:MULTISPECIES: pentapeptide repeat-containing protein [Trichocoleus]|uniref:Pentapeptide repeat-containing protein n=1 Tax=Trichocoleus desertorum GB2-A4 TaxID=2933944 RepID=A0ABV0JGM7_9CYAN|nr:pentapeptide repeat-containing protein [Trichocoleus sp. FACHB-46]MBD1865636.1 pentapeptide repeat-containing protein [Trichocoleus sp. FACHB-46]